MTNARNFSGAEVFENARRANRRGTRLTMHPIDYDPQHLPDPTRTAIEIKMDGIGLIWGARARPTPFTNEGGDMLCAHHLNPGLAELNRRLGGGWVFHGEYFADNFETTLSSFRSKLQIGAVWLHDAVPLSVWAGDAISAPLHQRRTLLREAIDGLGKQGVFLMRQATGHFDEEAVEDAAGITWEDDEEGIVVKDLDSPYVRGDSSFWMRLKRNGTLDLPIKACNRGDLGVKSITVGHDGKDVLVPIHQPRLKERAYEFRIGRVVEIKHNGLTAKGCLRSATFIRFRDDKGA